MNAHVVVVGAGGNIGSHLVPHLGRMPGVSAVTLIDGGTYEAANLAGQDVTPHDLGRSKAAVQAARLRRINRCLRVVARPALVESLPLGLLGADVILAGLDSRRARQWVNECAWHLGIPWIDAGVDGGRLLARVNVYRPARESPCLECAWDESDYAALDLEYGCAAEARSTGAPSAVGAVAAALLAIECQKLLSGWPVAAVPGRQVLIDLAHHTELVTSYRRNVSCRLADHEPWTIRPLPADPRRLSLGAAIARTGLLPARAVSVSGRLFSALRLCAGCGAEHRGPRFVSAVATGADPCRRCGGRLVAPGTSLSEHIPVEMVDGPIGARSLASLGIRRRDVLVITTDEGTAHWEIGGERT